MRRERSLSAGIVAAALLSGCAGGTLPTGHALTLAPQRAAAFAGNGAAPIGLRFVGFWQSWSDTDAGTAFERLGSVPRGVTDVDVAFATVGNNAVGNPQNTYPLGPGAAAVHRRGGRVILSIGGGGQPFHVTDAAAFVASLQAYVKAHPYYDGFDFDDEQIQNQGVQGERELIALILATRKAFAHAPISFDAPPAGANPHVVFANWQGLDRLVLERTATALTQVNVMDYDTQGYRPPGFAHCSYRLGARDDCYEDIVKSFAAVPVAGGGTFPKRKIVMGLMTGSDDYGAYVSVARAIGYASWVKAQGYGGMMIWSLSNDNPRSYPYGSGPKGARGAPTGAYTRAIVQTLGT